MRDMVMFLLAITSSSSYAAVLFFSQRIFSRGQRITPGDAMSEAPEGLPYCQNITISLPFCAV